jgi:MFS family permease
MFGDRTALRTNGKLEMIYLSSAPIPQSVLQSYDFILRPVSKRMKTPLSTTDSSAGRSLKTLTKSDFRTLGLAALGGALEFYDFIIFILTAGLTAGILLGSVVDIGITIVLPPAEVARIGWRIAFLLGGVFGICAALLRQWPQETPVFKEMSTRKALAAELPVKTVPSKHQTAVIISGLLAWMLTAAILVIILLTPQLLISRYHFSSKLVSEASCLAALFLTIGCVLVGCLSDRFGAPRVLMGGSVCLIIATYLFYADTELGAAFLLPLYAPVVD